MPLPKNTKFAIKKTSKGDVRLAFNPKGEVIEAKNLKTKKTHTQAEFKADKKRAMKDKSPDKTESAKRKMVEKKRGIKS